MVFAEYRLILLEAKGGRSVRTFGPPRSDVRRGPRRYLLSKKAESVLMLFEQTRGATLGLT